MSMAVRGYKYAFIHLFVHVIIAGLLYFVVQSDMSVDYSKLIFIAIGTAAIDLDHILLWKERGLVGYLKLRSIEEFGKPRKYKFHNLMVLFIAFGGALTIFIYEYFLIGLFFAAMSLHLLWDLFEDLVIFRMSYRHWL